MATARKSTKGRVCASCRKPKKTLDFPTTTAETCLQCLSDAANAPPPVVDPLDPNQSADEAPFIVPDNEIDYTAPTFQELAARTLARRKLIHFIQRFRPKYMPGWVHEDICRRLERFMKDVEDGKEPRLLLMMPVRHGKSEISSRHFAPFVLGHHPDWEIIAASGASSLALSFSRYIRDLVRSDSYRALFPEMVLDPSSQSVENWNTTKGGGYLAAGIGTMITGRGAHCLHPDTLISTESGNFTLEHLYLLKSVPRVTTPAGSKRVLAITKRPAPRLFELRFASGISIWATGEHPIYLPDRASYSTVKEIYGEAKNTDFVNLRVVREALRTTEVRGGQGCEARAQGPLLQSGLQSGTSCGEERQALRDLRQACSYEQDEPQCEVLLGRLQAEPSGVAAEDLPGVLRGISAEEFKAGLLQGELRRYGAHDPYAWGRELELSDGQRIRVLVRPNAPTDLEAGQRLCCLSNDGLAVLSSHQREPESQCTGELDHVVQDTPHGASQVEYDTLFMVISSGESVDFVYDLQVEEAGCFFANEILVGNCLIIDDPVKDAEAADSSVIRDATWEWYMSTALSRLAPGGGVLGILTWWNEDDWAGRVQQLSTMEDADKFEIVKYPAINDQGDEYILADDSIEQFPPGSTIPAGARMTRPKNTALHPARYTMTSLLKRKATYFGLGQQRWWHALYQQSPTVDDGVFFTAKMFRHYVTDPHPLERSTYQTWDFAITEGQQNDFTVGATGHVDERNNLHVADIVRFKSDDSFVIADAILDNWVEHGSCALIGFEDGVIWKSISAVFLRRCEERALFPSYELLVPLSDKAARAQPLRGLMQGGKVWFKEKAEWWEACRKELTQFLSGGKHDDIVDSLAWLARLALKHSAPRLPEPKKQKSWKDALSGRLRDLAGVSHMSA